MTIPIECYALNLPDDGPIRTAMAEASAIVERWRSSQFEDEADQALVSWQGVVLHEGIATALLEARGFDMDLLEVALERAGPDAVRSDVVALFERGELLWDDEGNINVAA